MSWGSFRLNTPTLGWAERRKPRNASEPKSFSQAPPVIRSRYDRGADVASGYRACRLINRCFCVILPASSPTESCRPDTPDLQAETDLLQLVAYSPLNSQRAVLGEKHADFERKSPGTLRADGVAVP